MSRNTAESRRRGNPLARAFYRGLMRSERLTGLYHDAVESARPDGFCSAVLDELDIALELPADARARIPSAGPLVVVANHPFGMLDGLLIMELLGSVRRDVRVMANSMLGMIPRIADRCILVEPYATKHALVRNRAAMRDALEWVCGGGALAVFPAGEVARWRPTALDVVELPWSDHAARIARRSAAPVLPVRFHGGNGPLFHGLGVLHPRLGSLALPHELLNKRGRTIRVDVGAAIPAIRLSRFAGAVETTEYLRWRTDALGDSVAARRRGDPIGGSTGAGTAAARVAIGAPEASSEELAREISSLPGGSLLSAVGGLEVYCARARDIPAVLREIGRLREVTFRAAGEGTGRALDLDRFDEHYRHLFLWHAGKREVAGAYRMGPVDEVPRSPAYGPSLYTRTLFDFHPRFLGRLDEALDLGRSFVRPEYQRSASALMLLWKGIGAFVLLNPRYRLLFGPVSISAEYGRRSRELIGAYLEERHLARDESRLVRPRHPCRIDRRVRDRLQRLGALGSIDDVSRLIADIEPDGKGVPVLLRQYLKLGGEVLSLSVDPDFADVIDGLIMVDLTRTERRVLGRYMGSEGARSFLEYHAASGGGPRGEG